MPQQLMIEGTYVKAKEVNQDRYGRMFNIPYIDDGVFWVMIFDLNKDQLTDPDKIKPGQVLRLP